MALLPAAMIDRIGRRYRLAVVGTAGAVAGLGAWSFFAWATLNPGSAAFGAAVGAAGVAAGAYRLVQRLKSEKLGALRLLEGCQAELKTMEIKYLGALNTAPDGLAGFKPDGGLAVVNDRMRGAVKEAGFHLNGSVTRDALLAFLLARASGEPPESAAPCSTASSRRSRSRVTGSRFP